MGRRITRTELWLWVPGQLFGWKSETPPISRGGVRRQVGDARAAMAYFRQKLAVFGDDFRGLAMTHAVVLRNALIDNGMDNPKVMEAAMSDPDGDLITLVFGGEWQGCTWSGGAGVRRP